MQGLGVEATFHWKQGPDGNAGLGGDLHFDASTLDKPGGLGSVGWAIAVVNPESDKAVALRSGLPPHKVGTVQRRRLVRC